MDARLSPTLLRDAKTVGATTLKLSDGAGCDPSPLRGTLFFATFFWVCKRK